MYTIGYSKFAKQYLVLNTTTGIAHSAWSTRLEAERTIRALNMH